MIRILKSVYTTVYVCLLIKYLTSKSVFSTDERKRKYNSMGEAKAPTEEDLEAYYLKRQRTEDPMANFIK